ncbi:MAG TPA: thrombospondin type 3 repeat-containing protein [Candidatus Polarisedimenticolia bacterium]|nr:thrombospondin type 3 repeat-containing protein [Candidatus Polarisedimenticolia bacterium]
MTRVVRVGLPALAAGILCLALSAGPAMATCGSGITIGNGVPTFESGFTTNGGLDPASCGNAPYTQFWAVGKGNTVAGLGVDQGASNLETFELVPGEGMVYQHDWGNQDVDGCISDGPNLQSDGSLPPMAVIFSNGLGQGTSGAHGTYAAYSVDLDTFFQMYNLDQANGSPNTVCANVPTPSLSGISGSGPFNATASWGGVSSYNDCASNSGISLADDCAGGTRNIHSGWKVYSISASCTLGPLTSDRSAWTQEGGVLPAGANAGSPVSISAANAGQCRFVAINPVWDSGFEGKYLSGAAAQKLGGTGDADGDGIADVIDTCPSTPGSNVDSDGDGIGDVCDNCDNAANQDQADGDNDNVGDACDPCPGDASNDVDGDGICGAVDNCPSVANPSQADSDGDGIGDACDGCGSGHDNDGDGICSNLDNCPDVANANQLDTDGDGKGNVCDPCPYEKSDDHLPPYGDNDGVCACEPAIFNAGLCPGTLGAPFDNCVSVSNASQTPSGMGDGLGDACEDKFLGTPIVKPNPLQPDQGFGDCSITFRTRAEWNCPAFSVVYRSPGGDRSTGVNVACVGCNSGVRNRSYGGATGFRISKCHGGHNIFVQMTRPSTCGGRPQYNIVTPVKIQALATRVR